MKAHMFRMSDLPPETKEYIDVEPEDRWIVEIAKRMSRPNSILYLSYEVGKSPVHNIHRVEFYLARPGIQILLCLVPWRP
ncbi:MAG TPA: hypothetical protein VFA52_01700 [Candidatus Paceibacterota bacterium]|nr:hypothetical protein [Candidatus Paceibacterota bacterium]